MKFAQKSKFSQKIQEFRSSLKTASMKKFIKLEENGKVDEIAPLQEDNIMSSVNDVIGSIQSIVAVEKKEKESADISEMGSNILFF